MIALLLLFGAPQKTHGEVLAPKTATTTQAASIVEATSTPPVHPLHALVAKEASIYGVSAYVMDEVISCESQWNTTAVSPTMDFGISQIHLASHPDITKTEAFNPTFSVTWMAQQFAEGHADEWTCYRNLQ